MKISATTGRLFEILGADGAFKMLSEAGFDAVDFSFDVDSKLWNVARGESSLFCLSQEQLVEHYRPYKQAADKYGVSIYQAHAPFPSYFHGNESASAAAVEFIKKCFPILKMMDCKYLVCHPCFAGYDNRLEKESEIKLNLNFYSSLIPLAKEYGVTVCLENMFTGSRGKIYEAICQEPDEVIMYVDTLNEKAGEKRFAFCYDTGHALLLGRDQYQTIKRIGNRIELLHVHDNDGWEDRHVTPYMGILDWDRFVMGLKAIGYKGVINLENSNIPNLYPRELLSSAFRHAADCAKYLAARVEG